jgi:PPOX class probable F420-dependent enzyme
MEPALMRSRLTASRVGRLATTSEGGVPHIVPCCFAVVGDAVYSAVDAKPKSTRELRRIANVRARPAASLLVDHYSDDWSSLWWVRVDGRARVIEDGPERRTAIAALQDKYEQYRAEPPPGAVVAIAIARWQGWSYDDYRSPRSTA